ncbi:MAG: PLP-dependent aminotransferase family protein [Methylophilaceae bacterium]
MLRAWDLSFKLDKSIDTSIYIQITMKIIEEIKRGRLAPSTVMPGSRKLASYLDVNRKTVLQAYSELVAQGWLSTEKRRGTFVSEKLPYTSSIEIDNVNDNWLQSEETISTNTNIAPTSNRDVIEFNDGIPDSRLIPFEIISRAFRHALVTSSRSNQLGYQDSLGMLSLRESVSHMLNIERGLNTKIENICIVRGSQMGIFLAARVLIEADDVVIFESLTYPPARDAFESCGAIIVSVGVDEDGMKVDELEKLCRKMKIRAIYVTPQHQYPTTVTMTTERRLRLLMLAEQYNIYVIEDDYDHEFHFSNHHTFPLASYGQSNKVIYVGSLSKVLAPGLRIGYLAALPEFIDKCAKEIKMIDRQGNSVTELAVSELMDSGELKRHIRRTAKTYLERRNLLNNLLRRNLMELVEFDIPLGGLAFWLRLKQHTNIDQFIKRAHTKKLRILPGCVFSDNNEDIQAFRLGFANLNNNELEETIQRLEYTFTLLTYLK